MNRRLLFYSVLLAATVLSGCGVAATAVVLTQADTDKSAIIATGQELRIELNSNKTTGYAWILASPADKVLQEMAKDEYVTDAHPEGVVGVGGKQIWHFKGAQAGTQKLKFEYRRAWEKEAKPAQTATFEITVK